MQIEKSVLSSRDSSALQANANHRFGYGLRASVLRERQKKDQLNRSKPPSRGDMNKDLDNLMPVRQSKL